MFSMGRPFSPTFASPDGVVDVLERLQLIYCYPLIDLFPIVPPIIISLNDALAYGVDISDAAAYAITLTDA